MLPEVRQPRSSLFDRSSTRRTAVKEMASARVAPRFPRWLYGTEALARTPFRELQKDRRCVAAKTMNQNLS
jgi:hypothetical protein